MSGAFEIIQKPFNLDQVFETIKKAIERRKR